MKVRRCLNCSTPLLSDGRHLNGDPGQFCDLNELLRKLHEQALDRKADRK